MSALSDFAQTYQKNLISGLAGGALGAGVGAFGTSRINGETDEELSKRRMGNTLSGGIAGGAAGFAAPTVADSVKGFFGPPPETGRLSKLWHHIGKPGASTTAGAAAGAGVGYFGGNILGTSAIRNTGALAEAAEKVTQHVGPDVAKGLGEVVAKQGPKIILGSRLGKILAGLGAVGGGAAGYSLSQ